MTTTIQIREETLSLLKRVRDSSNSKSYDEAIINIMGQRTKKSMAGFLGLKSKKQIMKGLRDKDDRL